ncbi:MAG: cation transporter [Clostridia bacterium]|nr:cation transporter [Clostridia bacterium]
MYKISVEINGMMCANCEKHMEEAFASLDGIKKVKASSKDKNAVIVSEEVIDEETIKSKVAEQGYEFVSYKCEKKTGLFG